MSTSLSSGTLILSIDLESDLGHTSLADHRALDAMTGRLLELLARHQLPATWGVADPAISAATQRIRQMNAGHELAILGDASWVGREAGRGRFGRELARRTTRAAAEGLSIRTLLVRTALPAEHGDLALKEGIVAVRQPAEGKRSAQPQTIKFGLWSFSVSYELPGASRWLPGGGGRNPARLAIDQAISDRGLAQLLIDAPRLLARGPSAERVLARVLEHVARRQRHGMLQVVTLGSLAGTLAVQNQGKPSRSILRPSAA